MISKEYQTKYIYNQFQYQWFKNKIKFVIKKIN